MSSLWERLLTLVAVYWLSILFSSWIFFLSCLKIIWYGFKILDVKPRPTPPACLSDPQLGTHSFIKLKDVKIHYVEAGNRNNPLMLFVHGFPEFWYSWRHQIKEFKKTHWVVAIDMRGYGDSDKPAAKSAYAISHLVNDIREVINGLGRDKCILVAHDWGGGVAWRFTIDYPEYVDKLVMMNCPHPTAFSIHLRSSFRQFLMSWYMFAVQIPYYPEKFLRMRDIGLFDKMFRDQIPSAEAFSDEDLEAYKYIYSRPGAFTPPLNYYRNIFFSTPALVTPFSKPAKEKRIEVPVLIIWGEKDIALHPKMADMSAKYVDNCTVKIIPNASHWIQQDQFHLVNEYMSDFLCDYSKPRRLVRKMKSMQRQLVSSVSGVMQWTGMISSKQLRTVKNDSGLVTKMGKRMFLTTFDILHRMSGAPLNGLQNMTVVI